MNEIEKALITEDTYDYKCYDELKRLIRENKDFYNTLREGLLTNHVHGFPIELWDKIRSQNIRRIRSFEDVFIEGANIGYCTVASKQLSYSFNYCYLCGGVLPILQGTKNCPNGNHTWIVSESKIIDTTLMLIIDESFASKFGYVEENRYNPNLDAVYIAAKDFALDSSVHSKR